MPIIKSGAVSPRAWAMPMMVPVSMPGKGQGQGVVQSAHWSVRGPDARRPPRGSRAAPSSKPPALAMMIVGRVISARAPCRPPAARERGSPKIFRKTARPRSPKTMEGTAARLLMLISMRSVHAVLRCELFQIHGGERPPGGRTASRGDQHGVRSRADHGGPPDTRHLRLPGVSGGEELRIDRRRSKAIRRLPTCASTQAI